jgi:putative endonuclease
MNRKRIGEHAESLACGYLKRRGLRLLSRNFRCRRGEIDLIMRDGDSLVFVEVRYRKLTHFGHPTETVSRIKQTRIIHCARYYMHIHHSWNEPARFDVISIEGKVNDMKIEWLSDAFQADSD